MKKLAFSLVALIIIGIVGVTLTTPKYNEMVKKDEFVNKQFGQLQNQLQRQYELIPNLVNSVQAEAQFEKDTFKGVAEARSQAGGKLNIDEKVLANDPEAQKRLNDAQNSLAQSFSRLLSVQERYPQLNSNKAFQDLRQEISRSANRVAIARKDTQDAVIVYNNEVRQMPGKLVASIYGFNTKPYFNAVDSAQSGSGLVKFDK